MPNRYCFYRMTNDAGSAPNPFYGICTLAICTPNHQRAQLSEGNVIVGVEADSLICRRRKKWPDSTNMARSACGLPSRSESPRRGKGSTAPARTPVC
jgi:hypothetical protein